MVTTSVLNVTVLATCETLSASTLEALAKDVQKRVDKNNGIVGELIAESKHTPMIMIANASHLVRNVRYNSITETITCDIHVISTPRGLHLERILRDAPETISWSPVLIYDDSQESIRTLTFLTVNAKYTKVNNA